MAVIINTTCMWNGFIRCWGSCAVMQVAMAQCNGVLSEVLLSTGPLHTAPSFSGGTVQTGLTMDAVELQQARSGVALPSSSSQAPGDLPPSKLQRHGSATHASSLEQVCCNPFSCCRPVVLEGQMLQLIW